MAQIIIDNSPHYHWCLKLDQWVMSDPVQNKYRRPQLTEGVLTKSAMLAAVNRELRRRGIAVR